MKFKIIIVFSVIFLQSIGCTYEHKGFDDFKNIEFNVDTELLSSLPLVIEDVFELRIPKDWYKLNDDNFIKFKNVIESDSAAFFKISLLNVFNSPNGSYSIISKIISDNNVFEKIDSTYITLLAENFKTNNINIGRININGINTIQYLISTKDKVIIKLILKIKKSYYQIDYIIPLEIYEKELKKIESSIGSINKI